MSATDRIIVQNNNLNLFWNPALFHAEFSIVEVNAKEWREHFEDNWNLDKCVAMLKKEIEAGNYEEVDV